MWQRDKEKKEKQSDECSWSLIELLKDTSPKPLSLAAKELCGERYISIYWSNRRIKHRKAKVSWKVKFKCYSCFFPSLPCLSSLSYLTCLWHFSPDVVAKCLPKWPAWKVSLVGFVRKLEVVHKHVGSCLISCLRKLEVNWKHCPVDHSKWGIMNDLVSPTCR